MFKSLLKKYAIFDRKLIDVFQYVVRQFELYTDVTKKYLMYICNSIFVCIVIFIIYNATDLDIGSVSGIIVMFGSTLFTLLFLKKAFQNYKRIKSKKDDVSEAAFEIVFLFELRLIMWFGLFCFLMLISSDLHTYLTNPLAEESQAFMSAFKFNLSLTFNSVIDIIVEYLFCTYSLPPGEKKKREKEKKMEKEMQNAVPNT